LPAAITRQGEDVAVGVAEVDVVLVAAAEGDWDKEGLMVALAQMLARADAVVVWDGEFETRRLDRVAFEEGVVVRQAEPDWVTEVVPFPDLEPDALTERVVFRDAVSATVTAAEAVALTDWVSTAETDAVDVAFTV
jgi:hypothetical protein